MKIFNPENAEMVDDADEASDLEGFLGRVDMSVKSMRVRVIEEAFRELTKVAKKERSELLDAATTKFCEEMEKCREAMCGDIEKVGAQVGKVADGVTAIASDAAVQAKRSNNRLDALNVRTKDICECTTRMHERMDAQEAASRAPVAPPASDPHAAETATALKAILASLEQIRATPAPTRPSYNFRIVRDDFARASNIIATPI